MTVTLSGKSFETAIKFTEIKSEGDGVAAEYEFLAEKIRNTETGVVLSKANLHFPR